jgi:hypothetical protein
VAQPHLLRIEPTAILTSGSQRIEPIPILQEMCGSTTPTTRVVRAHTPGHNGGESAGDRRELALPPTKTGAETTADPRNPFGFAKRETQEREATRSNRDPPERGNDSPVPNPLFSAPLLLVHPPPSPP